MPTPLIVSASTAPVPAIPSTVGLEPNEGSERPSIQTSSIAILDSVALVPSIEIAPFTLVPLVHALMVPLGDGLMTEPQSWVWPSAEWFIGVAPRRVTACGTLSGAEVRYVPTGR